MLIKLNKTKLLTQNNELNKFSSEWIKYFTKLSTKIAKLWHIISYIDYWVSDKW